MLRCWRGSSPTHTVSTGLVAVRTSAVWCFPIVTTFQSLKRTCVRTVWGSFCCFVSCCCFFSLSRGGQSIGEHLLAFAVANVLPMRGCVFVLTFCSVFGVCFCSWNSFFLFVCLFVCFPAPPTGKRAPSVPFVCNRYHNNPNIHLTVRSRCAVKNKKSPTWFVCLFSFNLQCMRVCVRLCSTSTPSLKTAAAQYESVLRRWAGRAITLVHTYREQCSLV